MYSTHSTHISARGNDVCRCLLKGLQNKEISQELGITYSTVKNYITYLNRVIGVGSRTELVIALLTRNNKGNICPFKYMMCQEGICPNCIIFIGEEDKSICQVKKATPQPATQLKLI